MIRHLYNISNDDRKFAELMQKEKSTLEQNFSVALDKVENTLNLLAKPNLLSEELDLQKNKNFWNVARYINIISLDLKTLAKHQALSTNEWEKRYFARQVALLIYESIDDLLSLFGKSFKVVTEDLHYDDSFVYQLNEVRASLNVFKNKHIERLEFLRNISIAHRDKNTELQLKTIYSISWLESVNLCSEYDAIINRMGQFLEKMMRKGINDGPVIFNAY